jgi:hypothetical protein
MTYQYITPSIPPSIFLQMPFVRPAFFEYGLSLPDFKRRSKLDIKDDEPVEVVIRIDGSGSMGGQGSNNGSGHAPGLLGGECLGRSGCGEGIELRAEVEVMTTEGKIVKKRALAQVMVVNPYQNLPQEKHNQGHHHHHSQAAAQGPGSSMVSVASSGGSSIAAASNRSFQSHHCTGVRIAKIKAVLPPETVVGPGGVRKGVVHIYAGRKVEHVSESCISNLRLLLDCSMGLASLTSITRSTLSFLGTERCDSILVGPVSSYPTHRHHAKDSLQLCAPALFTL